MSKGMPFNVKQCLEKSRDSALLAVETYNKPQSVILVRPFLWLTL